MGNGSTDPRTTRSKFGDRVSNRFRDRRSSVLRAAIADVFARRGAVRILDLGGRYEFWRRFGLDFLTERKVDITILNLTASESGGVPVQQGFSFEIGDATGTGFADGSYDIVVSNSVIEHLGTWDAMIRFAEETRRLAPVYYCQTPNFWFPIDPHYYKAPLFHWLPRPTRAWLLRKFPIATAGKVSTVRHAYAITDYARLLSRTQMRDLFPDADLVPERFLGVFVKSWMAVRKGGVEARR